MANPFLPEWEYIPDGEPRVFGSRVYLRLARQSRRGQFLRPQVKSVVGSR